MRSRVLFPRFLLPSPILLLTWDEGLTFKNSELNHVAPKFSLARSVDVLADGIPVAGQAASSGPDAKRNRGGMEGELVLQQGDRTTGQGLPCSGHCGLCCRAVPRTDGRCRTLHVVL